MAFGTAFYAITRFSRAVDAQKINFQYDRTGPTNIITPYTL